MKFSTQPLSNNELKRLAPSLFTAEPYYEASDKYHFISTIDIIEEIRFHAWYPVAVSEASVRNEDKEGYQQHYVRFRYLDDFLRPSENCVELLLFNSHDRSKCFTISAGVFRFVCANGLVVADEVFESYQIKHIGEKANGVAVAIPSIVQAKDKIMDKISTFSQITLTEQDKISFAS
ncbi:DUF932 domain-containing protein [Helicobacter acinonychis]|uniref:DUF932 domain-containing protein n=1 Tax=Helicobacter acinonychis (strain Sheeba) TaxID=382638 RepID=Q17W97_HELAH|nr:DUF932 domain-containing protein [Helicobacter acinonychis]CAK00079.1 conserved hypothetical protein [Helicobacter acinonychis str. Sheeba]STP03682.1 Domain of uncharacterised function (DUF932) [Helicobacter acinonychis]